MSTILLNRFNEIEHDIIMRNLIRLEELIQDDLTTLTIEARDYAAWTETYQYMINHNQHYVEDNYNRSNLEALDLNVVLLLTPEGRPLFSQIYHSLFEESTLEHIPTELQRLLGQSSPFVGLTAEQSILFGVLPFSKAPLLFAAHAILTTERTGPSRGSLVMGRYLTPDKIAQLGKLMQLKITMQALNQAPISQDFQQAWQQLQAQTEPRLVIHLSAKKAAGYLLVTDFYQQPVLIFKLEFQRELYQQGLNSIYYINIAILLTGLILITALFLLLEKVILARLTRINAEVTQVSLEQPSQIYIDQAHDELSQLTTSINAMLRSLHHNHQQLKRSETRLKNAQRIAHVGHWEWELSHNTHYWSQELFQLLGLNTKYSHPNEQLFLRYVHPVERQRVQQAIEQTKNTGHANELEHRLLKNGGQERIIHTRLEALAVENDVNHYLIATMQDVTETRRAQAETERLLNENRFLIHRSIAIQEKERSYLARELHDQFGQSITAIQADAETIFELAQKPQNNQVKQLANISISVQAILNLSSQMYSVMHNLLQYLRPSGLEELGLELVLEMVLKNWRLQHPQIQCLFYAEGDLTNLGEQINITVYRLIQECLNNISRHANASQVTIQLTHDTETGVLILKVVDNGQGMDLYQDKWGLGLIGMRERVQALEGEMQVISQPTQGMQILLILPVGEELQQDTWH
jgi:signal transduction histidine kinase